jgi:hypothetical protein
MTKNISALCSLIVQFSFLPQVIWAALLYRRLVANSYVLINTRLHIALFVVFIEIIVFAVLTSPRKFYFTRFLLAGAYLQLLATFIWFDFRLQRFIELHNEAHYFIAFGALMTALNVIALYIHRQIREKIYELE